MEEIPPPGADNDIQFPSFVAQPTFMRLPSTESATEPTPPSDMPARDKSSRYAGAKAVMTLKRTMLLSVCVCLALARLAMRSRTGCAAAVALPVPYAGLPERFVAGLLQHLLPKTPAMHWVFLQRLWRLLLPQTATLYSLLRCRAHVKLLLPKAVS